MRQYFLGVNVAIHLCPCFAGVGLGFFTGVELPEVVECHSINLLLRKLNAQTPANSSKKHIYGDAKYGLALPMRGNIGFQRLIFGLTHHGKDLRSGVVIHVLRI